MESSYLIETELACVVVQEHYYFPDLGGGKRHLLLDHLLKIHYDISLNSHRSLPMCLFWPWTWTSHYEMRCLGNLYSKWIGTQQLSRGFHLLPVSSIIYRSSFKSLVIFKLSTKDMWRSKSLSSKILWRHCIRYRIYNLSGKPQDSRRCTNYEPNRVNHIQSKYCPQEKLSTSLVEKKTCSLLL